MSGQSESRVCTCGSRVTDILRVPPPKKDWLRKATCPGCGKVFWANRNTDYCMDREPTTLTHRGVSV